MDADISLQHSQVQLRYHKLVENLPGCVVFVLDRNLRVLFAGGGLATYATFRPHYYIGLLAAEVATPRVYAYAEPYLLAALAGKEMSFEFDYPAGPSFEVRTAPLQDDGAAATEVLVVALDTTERKRAAAAERSAQWVLHQAVEAANIGLWDMDLHTNRVHYSHEWKQQLGCEDGEVGDSLDEWDRRLHPDDLAQARALIADYLASPWPNYEQEFRLRHKDGSYRWILARGTVYFDADGKPARMLGVDIDITERRVAEDALRESEAALRRSQAVAHIGHWAVDKRRKTVTWSDEMKHILGAGTTLPSHSLDEALRSAIHPDDMAHVREMRARVRDGVGPLDIEFRILRPDGTVRYLWAMSDAPERDSEGNILRQTGVMQDITERKLREMEREQMRAQLQRQEQLAAVGQLAAGIAHDFNNIMSVISVYAEMVGEAPGLGAKDQARTQAIVDQTQRAARLIRQILDFSRRAVYARQALDLLPLLKEVAKLLRQTLPESIEVRLDCAPGEYFVLADPTRIQQLVMNLALNARDAMPDGGLLHVGLGHAAVAPGEHAPVVGMMAGNWVQIVVSDTGTGIPPEHMEHIFDPFFTTKEPGKGTGLGLAQVQGIVAQHEGHIAVASEPGGGTIFTVYLPVAIAPSRAAEPPPAQAPPQGQGECVLLVEDDAAVRSSLASLLEGWNYRVVQAANGQEALACLARPSQLVDVILSDVVMPRLGGIGLVKALRKDGVTTPVILMSGYAAGEDRRGLNGAEVAAWLDKPPSPSLLAAALAGALGRG